jgi:CheY-like chemotaxis protein
LSRILLSAPLDALYPLGLGTGQNRPAQKPRRKAARCRFYDVNKKEKTMAHILIIDDDEPFRDMLVHMLTLDAHRVTAARDGEEGLRLCRQTRPDLIITDILMPQMDGIELIMELARQGNGIPIIAISGGRRSISAEFNLKSASLVGVKATLAKPFARADLRQAIQQALG